MAYKYPVDTADLELVNELTTGESTLPRRYCIYSNLGLTNGYVRLTYFTARKTETVTQVRTICTVAAVGSTLSKVGVYSVATNGDLTLVASTANLSATLWIATNTAYTSAFAASFTKTRGTRYAVAELAVGTSTAPQLWGLGNVLIASEVGVAPRLTGHIVSQTDLPSTISAASVQDSAHNIYAALLP